nr:MAG TPA: hypothetical protein [Caudoviricetes sp.]
MKIRLYKFFEKIGTNFMKSQDHKKALLMQGKVRRSLWIQAA